MKVPESKFKYVSFEFPGSPDRRYFIGLDDAGVLRSCREQMGFTQQEVANRAGMMSLELDAHKARISGVGFAFGGPFADSGTVSTVLIDYVHGCESKIPIFWTCHGVDS